jgi:hypothetical protein
MADHHKKLERRTFSQDRYDILIKRQKEGKATFEQLTELDEIVNRDPSIREKVIFESLLPEGMDNTDGPQEEDKIVSQPKPHRSFLSRIKSFIDHVFGSFLAFSSYSYLQAQ